MAGTITALQAHKTARDRINVYLDGGYAFDLALIHALWLRIGQPLTDDEIEALKQADTLEKARQRAVDLIAYRPRSEQEVRRRLRQAQVDTAVIDEVIASITSAGLLDDQAFSQAWVDSRQRTSPRSKRMMAWELERKGVSPAAVEAAVDGLDDDETAYRAVLSRWPKVAGVEPAPARRRKLSEYLARHGFDYDTIQAAVERVEREMRMREEGQPGPSE